MALTETIAPITGIANPAQARVVLYQAGRPVHAPLDSVGLLTEGEAASTYLPLAGGTMTGALTTNGQIVFPATQNPSANANTLDDYERGTWTPSWLPNTGAYATLTYARQSGDYVKVGSMVIVSGSINVTAVTIGTATGELRIGGLPFVNSSAFFGSGPVSYSATFVTNWPLFVAPIVGSSLMRVAYKSAIAGNSAFIQAANIGAASDIYFAATYIAD